MFGAVAVSCLIFLRNRMNEKAHAPITAPLFFNETIRSHGLRSCFRWQIVFLHFHQTFSLWSWSLPTDGHRFLVSLFFNKVVCTGSVSYGRNIFTFLWILFCRCGASALLPIGHDVGPTGSPQCASSAGGIAGNGRYQSVQ